MNEPSLIVRQRQLLHDLDQFAVELARLEPALLTSFRQDRQRLQEEHEELCAELRERLDEQKETLAAQLEEKLQLLQERIVQDQEAIQKKYTKGKAELIRQFEAEKEAIESTFQEACWTADATFDTAKSEAKTRHLETNKQLDSQLAELRTTQEQARSLIEQWQQPAATIESVAARNVKSAKKQPRPLQECLQQAKQLRDRLSKLTLPHFKGARLFGLVCILWLGLIVPLGLPVAGFLRVPGWPGILGLGAVASLIVSGIWWILAAAVLESLLARQVESLYRPLSEAVLEGELSEKQLRVQAKSEFDEASEEAQEKHRRDLTKAQTRQQQKLADLAERRVSSFVPLEGWLKSQRDAAQVRYDDERSGAQERHQRTLARLEQEYQQERDRLEAGHRGRLEELEARHRKQWLAKVHEGQYLLSGAEKTVAALHAECEALFPDWHDPSFWETWKPATSQQLPVMRFGSYQVRTEMVQEEPPWEDPRPFREPREFTLPALGAFPESCSILFHAQDEGRTVAIESLQTIMFRLLTTLPPGRVRFLIVDPVGLGQNFASFMTLADHDELLVSSRIWTEAPHIEQRLADLTGHMENVIQKYLRNRYATISEYNAHAEEVAEPYRVLVVANFPTNFTSEAMRRLASIIQGGPRCGVAALVSLDRKLPLPRDFDLADLERGSVNLDWEEGRFVWRDEDFARFPLTLDQLPPRNLEPVLHQIGDAARRAHRVEVPFEFIAPPPESWWTGSTREGIRVPLGRAGATRRQHLELGKGTSQHALVAGKTGSGKSTLLHALITNLALLYSPDEVELYLVDFKKGVEFKTYAVHELPHARVLAVESEREFGLSVLSRLDAELKTRGERFRAVGAQDLAAYRQARPQERMPRVLLIVDEFQEFFVEDDRLAQEAARLLDRLVRQGRAFGIHVLLGSQTLGGAYSLARSTIDQMAVRIALQCSEADAHLILSDDNSAARLLTRPGEAIYNDANGLVEGNDPFQVVWLGEETRERYLSRLHELVQQHPARERLPMVVFEGNAPAEVSRNSHLERVLKSLSVPEDGSGQVEYAWLGEAMAIDELTVAAFRRQNGSNLVILGQQPEAALGMLTVGLVSLAGQGRNGSAGTRFYVLDGHQADAPRQGPLPRLAEALQESMRLAGWREAPAILAELIAELERRQAAPEVETPSVYLVLYGLQRMRDLRRAEDDFGFSSKDGTSPAQQLATLLREGAGLGMHVLIWCDTLGNLQRSIDRQTMRELTMRVAFQMNVADSSNLLDSPAASKLGLHRALFANEEEGKVEKFRPYGVPSDEWLAWVSQQLQRRTTGVA